MHRHDPTPGRKRRRTAIVALLVSLAAGMLLAWWWMLSLSRTEQRFLGTWSLPGSAWQLEITFHADRTFTREPTGTIGFPSTGYWYVDDSELVMVHRLGAWLKGGGRVRYTAARLADPKLVQSVSENLEIVSIEADTIRLRGSKNIIDFIRTDPLPPKRPPSAR